MQALVLVAISALAWGLWWLPLAGLETQGMSGLSANLAMNLGATLVAALACLRPSGRLGAFALRRDAILGAVLVGLAVTAYGNALLLTQVSRAILLFYLAPAWGLAFEITLIGRRFRPVLLAPNACGFAAMLLVVGSDLSLQGLRLGDGLALFSGAAWALGAALLFRQPSFPIAPVTALSLAAASLGILPLAMASGGLAVLLQGSVATWSLGLLAGALLLSPVVAVALWGASRLGSVTVSLVLTLEIFSGLGSAAWLLDEQLGPRKFAALALIFLAIALQLWLDRSRTQDG